MQAAVTHYLYAENQLMTDKITLRRATAHDVARLAEIADTALFPGKMLPDMIAPFFKEADCLWQVAEMSDDIAGFAFAEPEPMTDGTWNLRAIAVAEPARGRGLGRALLGSVEEDLMRRARLLIIDTTQLDDQYAGRMLYAASGYAQVAEIQDFWEPGANKVTFAKTLHGT